MNNPTTTPDLTTAIYHAIDAFQRTHRTSGGLQHAQIRALLAEHLARTLPAASAVAESRVSYLLESRPVGSDTWQRIGLRVSWENRAKAEQRLAAARELYPDREHRLITRTTTTTETPTTPAAGAQDATEGQR